MQTTQKTQKQYAPSTPHWLPSKTVEAGRSRIKVMGNVSVQDDDPTEIRPYIGLRANRANDEGDFLKANEVKVSFPSIEAAIDLRDALTLMIDAVKAKLEKLEAEADP